MLTALPVQRSDVFLAVICMFCCCTMSSCCRCLHCLLISVHTCCCEEQAPCQAMHQAVLRPFCCRPLSKTVRFNVLRVIPAGSAGKKAFASF